MITQWDIVSGIRARDNAILYTLLIDGTEQDARLIAKKLKGYVQEPQPANAPFVYSFQLPEDLDEATLEKIRVAVREGIEQAKKVNEFMPGGSLGNPLFSSDVIKDDKDFPTFITLDPSESFFQDAQSTHQTSTQNASDNIQDQSVQTKEEPLESIDNAGYRSDPDNAPTPPALPKEETAAEEALTSVEADEAWSDEPPQNNIGLEVQAIETPVLPEGFTPTPTQLPRQQAEEGSPLSNKDMFNKDMEGTLLDPSLEDIFSAETKYDMFVDVDKLPPAKQVPQSAISQPEHEAKQDEDAFNIFEQKIKDQTCFVDLDDVKAITDRIPKKDMDFIRHAQVPATPKAPDLKPAFYKRFEEENKEQEEVMDPFEQLLAAAPQAPAGPVEKSAAPLPTTENPPEPDTQQEPSQIKEEPTLAVRPEESLEEDVEVENLSLPAKQADEPALTQTDPTAPFTAITENNMSENTGNNQPNAPFETASGPKPQAPAAPQTPAELQTPAMPTVPVAPHVSSEPQIPSVPAAPAAPQVPSGSQAPAAPAAPIPTAPTTSAAASVAAAPNTTILRRRSANNTILEKTRTIDHSIELPLSELKKHNWPLEVPLVPTYTLENTVISVNRFAHATAISVIDNPGKLYNPLVLHGPSGTGKTHFLHAIGYALSKKYGQENIFITNGVRLSRGVQRYIMEGNIDKFDKFIQSAKAMLIDDIHLLAINEQNRAYIAKLLSSFRAQQKQIVMTSKYPPESLAKLEELLNFRLDSGWISEMKPASGTTRTRLIRKILRDNSIDLTEKDQENFFGQANTTLGTIVRSIRRVRVLEKLILTEGPNYSTSSIFDLLLATNGEDRKSLILQKGFDEITDANVQGNGEWGRIGFFYPQNHSDRMNWMLFALQQRAKELGIEGGPELAVRSSYSTENIISSAFKIANLCDNKKLKGAVILGPDIDSCDPSVRENFYDILTHMLEIMLIRCGVINYENITSPSTYVKALSELLR